MLHNPWFDCAQEQKVFFFSFVRTGCLGHPASCSVGNAGLAPSCKVAGARATTNTSVCSIFKISGTGTILYSRIFGPRRDEVTGDWRRLHNEELNDLYFSPNIVLVIKSRRMRWAGHVARMAEERVCIGSWLGNRRERYQ